MPNPVTRRGLLGGGAGLAVAAVLAGCGRDRATGGLRGAVFNTASADVTLFDPATNAVTGRSGISTAVRWLSNEQRFWDGRRIWTYDFPGDEVRAVAIDPDTFRIDTAVPIGGRAPGHSFVLTPDRRRGFVNAANSDFVAVVDPVVGTVADRVPTGAFP